MPLLADDSHIARLAADLDDLRIGHHRRVVGVDEDLAEAAREGLLLRGVEPLIAEEDHAVVEEGPPHRGDARRVELGAQVDAVELGAQRAGDGTDLDRHRSHGGSPGAQYRFLR